jgi:tRNA pseudouridine38-40 synthase
VTAADDGGGGGVAAPAAAADPEPEPLPLCYAAVVAYDGTRFAGFQLQAGRRAPTVQGELERALRRLTGASRRALRVQGAGRTDAGVHARGQCVQWRAPRALAPAAARRALNKQLPPDVRVLRVEAVPTDYNCRFSSGKEYWYDVDLGGEEGEEEEEGGEGEGEEGEEEGAGGGAPAARGGGRFDPFATAFLRYRLRPPRARAFDLAAAAAAAAAFEGEHDFGAFSSLARDGRDGRGTVRRVRRCALEPLPGGARLVVEGPGFLYKQVRHMAGAVLAAGAGRLAPADVAAALRAGAAGGAAVLRGRSAVAEARGLCLARVALPPHPGPGALMYPGGAPLLRREELAARELA